MAKGNIHIPTTLDPEVDLLVVDLGEKRARWIYGALWLRLRTALIGDTAGPLREALRAEIDLVHADITKKCKKAISDCIPRQALDDLLDEKEVLEHLQAWLAPAPERQPQTAAPRESADEGVQ